MERIHLKKPERLMEVERGKLPGIVLSLFGKRSRGLRLEKAGVTVLGRPKRCLSFSEVAGLAGLEKGFPFSSLSVPLTDGSDLRITGINSGRADTFVAAFNEAWRASIRAQVEASSTEIDTLDLVVKRLYQPRRYPAACVLEPYRTRTETLFTSVPLHLPEEALPADQRRVLDRLAAFQRDPARIRDRAINTYIAAELREMDAFFERIESNPLTPEQRLAVVTDEDATLVLAGAGSGKTSVIVAKAAYLIERGIRRPEEILLLAFGQGCRRGNGRAD